MTLLPCAWLFLAAVLPFARGHKVQVIAWMTAAYLLGGGAFAWSLRQATREAFGSISADGDVGEAISRCLTRTEIAALIYWAVWGVAVASVAAVLTLPTLLGFEYFVQSALIIAVPSVAWSYWRGKSLLLDAVGDAPSLRWHGRVYPIGVKLALVFISFFIVATGAIVLLVTASVAARLEASGINSDELLGQVSSYAGVIVAFTTIILGAATTFLARDITRPLERLIDLGDGMAAGNFASHARVFADDEVGRLATSFVRTRDNLRGLVGRISSSGTAIAGGARTIRNGTSALVTAVHEQRGASASASGALDVVRNGARLVLDSVEKVESAAVDSAGRTAELNASSSEVAMRMDELSQSAEKTSSGTAQIEAAAREMARRADELSSVGNEVLAFVAEMDAAIVEIGRTADATAALSKRMRENAVSGREAVEATESGVRVAQESTRRTAHVFDALQKSLGQIDEILLVIEELTNRTNLLSLNAAIIAAQAGANDFGFSVIADEVRQLAERTRSSTADVAEIIRGLRPIAAEAGRSLGEGVGTVDRTVDLTQRAAESLAMILRSADESFTMSQGISSSLKEQTQASSHLHNVTARVNDNLHEVNRAAKSNAEAIGFVLQETENVRDIALYVKRSTEEQLAATSGIGDAMEQIAGDVKMIRRELTRQLERTGEIAAASKTTAAVAEKNETLSGEFSAAVEDLVRSGKAFEDEVAKFRV